MRKIARFIVAHRIAIAAVFFVLAGIFGVATLQVTVNKDMSRYLPADMQVKQGMDIMIDEFGESTSVSAMVKCPSADERSYIKDKIGELALVTSVTYETDSADFNNGDYALYSITLQGNQYSKEVENAVNAVGQVLDALGYEYWISADIGNEASTLGGVYVVGILLSMIILFTLATSWIEPVLVLITIVVAVLINMGTNVFFPSVSETTFSIAAILQMALSMDYLIMLMNRYRDERENHPPELAMENALTEGVRTIASSSITTVVGLLCLVFMSFTIGADLGIVLAKGVFLSLICVFLVQPSLTIAGDKLLFSTAKPYPQPKMRRLTSFEFKARIPLLILFLALFVVGYSLRDVTEIDFISANDTEESAAVEEVFPSQSQIVVLYEKSMEQAAAPLIERFGADERVARINCYEDALGTPYTAEEIAGEAGIPESLARMLYYYRFNNGDVGALSRDAFLSYVRNEAQTDLAGLADETTLSNLGTVADLVEANVSAGTYTPEALAAAVNKHSISANSLKLLYLAYRSSHDADPSWTMTLDDLTAYLANDIMEDELFASSFDSATRKTITEARASVEEGAALLRGQNYDRVVLYVPGEADSEEMVSFLNDLRAAATDAFGDAGWYLVGQAPMAQEMDARFPSEFSFLSVITIASILIIVLVTFRSAAIPILLVALIQSAFCWDMLLNYALGVSIFYLALLVVQSILMGATIDYAILYTETYREARATRGRRDAAEYAYRHSVRTIFMSGGILVVVTGVIGMFASGLTGKICLVISEGALIAVALVLLVLPGTIMALDRFVAPKGSLREV